MAIIKFNSTIESKMAYGIFISKGFSVSGNPSTMLYAQVDGNSASFRPEGNGIHILLSEWIRLNPLQLKDLQTGMWIERGGEKFLVQKELNLFVNADGYDLYKYYDSDLYHIDGLHITAIFIPRSCEDLYTGRDLKCIWKRKEVTLTLRDIVKQLNLPYGTVLTIKK